MPKLQTVLRQTNQAKEICGSTVSLDLNVLFVWLNKTQINKTLKAISFVCLPLSPLLPNHCKIRNNASEFCSYSVDKSWCTGEEKQISIIVLFSITSLLSFSFCSIYFLSSRFKEIYLITLVNGSTNLLEPGDLGVGTTLLLEGLCCPVSFLQEFSISLVVVSGAADTTCDSGDGMGTGPRC